MKQIEKKINKLRNQIREADYYYYVKNDPQISDKEYDNLLNRLKSLEKKHPRLITPDSPTQRVSGGLLEEFPAVKHKTKMLSLDNTYSIDELKEWEKRMKRTLKKDIDFNYMCELKIDGISCSLNYQNGRLAKGLTRGDGQQGEDITPNIKTIGSIPLKLRKNYPKNLEVRGEVYISKKDFQSLNSQRLKEGKTPFANPRNAAGGSLKLLDPSLVAKRNLKCFIHSFGWVEDYKFKTQQDFLQKITGWGLRTQKENRLCKNLKEVIDYCKDFQQKRDNLGYEADGVVVKINSLSLQKKLGSTQKSPRWAVAYKFPAIRKTTKIKKVEFGVGRTGTITPVAILRPVSCGGATIKRATLHNFDEIKRLGIKIGDTVLIERAGDVIPKIIKVIDSKRTGREKAIKEPKKCPICNGAVEKEEVYLICLNPNCPSKLKRSLVHFASRTALDIEGMGESLVKELVEKKIVKNLSDIYKLTQKKLLVLPLFKEKKANNIIKAIEESKKRPLNRLLFGLGIPHIGQKAANTLAEQFGSLNRIKTLKKEDLEKIDEIGPIMAKSIVKFFSQKSVKKTLKDLEKLGVSSEKKERKKSNKLSGQSFVFTGQLEHFSRNQAQKKVEELGGKWSSSVSNKTDFLVAGSNPGSKYGQAKEKKVKILSEDNFLKLVGI
ncbi:MAG: NAD-dependent DNA ligase LigA [Candidatus Omnitrophica bacterium]|nr:NAD-dependent DNA ligase LigA [Candidatus Omnitrophota bacterium]MCF7876817.1 NAD-dependent DNA ligase LigA [Candidatus Omnitrophota bacterium]MCF7878112.1 NAD-dependent DNA ligase LigA [Candidatus Omnitrophota bacterium]MCF7892984.1 NAD-dependent DNA ligase LigA [Candidatus Omnitrophota bacterium]